MIYTVHLGPREQAWPGRVAQATTREAACRIAREVLEHAPEGVTHAQVRLREVLLDDFGRRPTGSVRSLYQAAQRERAPQPGLPL